MRVTQVPLGAAVHVRPGAARAMHAQFEIAIGQQGATKDQTCGFNCSATLTLFRSLLRLELAQSPR